MKNPESYYFDSEAVDREPYMAPGLVTPEKVARGKLPTDVWWHTIVSTNGSERTGYATQKPEGVLRRIVQASSAPGDRVLDFFAGCGYDGRRRRRRSAGGSCSSTRARMRWPSCAPACPRQSSPGCDSHRYPSPNRYPASHSEPLA